jgi:hypothetical protein
MQVVEGCEGEVKRVDIRAILRDPKKSRDLMIRTIIATQAREGIVTTEAQAAAAWDKVQREKFRL